MRDRPPPPGFRAIRHGDVSRNPLGDMTDSLDFLDASASEADGARADTARDEQGRFVSPAPEQAAPGEQAASQSATPPEPTTAPDPEPGLTPSGHVPLSALLDTRDKAKAAEARAKEAEERLAAIEAAKQAPQGPPDRYADPDAYDDWFQADLVRQQRALQTEVLAMRAEAKHGPELVSEVVKWARDRCSEDPSFNARMLASANRVEDAILAYQQEQALSALSDPEQLRAFNEWRAGQSAAPASEQAAPAPQSPQPPPRSIASLPAAGAAKPGQQPVGAGVAFDAAFPE